MPKVPDAVTGQLIVEGWGDNVKDNVNASHYPTWTNFAFDAGFSNFGGGHFPASYCIYGDIVEWRGSVRNASIITATAQTMLSPGSFPNPPATLIVSASCGASNGAVRIDIRSGSTVLVRAYGTGTADLPANQYISLAGIRYQLTL